MSRVYEIDFRQFLEWVKVSVSLEAERFVCYWESPGGYVLEYPAVNNSNVSMGFVLHSEVPKGTVIDFVRSQASLKDVNEPQALRYFESQYLAGFTRVLGVK